MLKYIYIYTYKRFRGVDCRNISLLASDANALVRLFPSFSAQTKTKQTIDTRN